MFLSDTPGQCLLPQLSMVVEDVEVGRLHPQKRQQTGPFLSYQVSTMRSLNSNSPSISSPHSNYPTLAPNSLPRGFLVCLFTAPAVSSQTRQGSVPSRSYQWSSKTSKSDDFTLKYGSKRVLFCPTRCQQ
eukprot:scaffold20186_cov71-Cyclotella_meneghiniana.AAC.5